ncbi:hypothetical protein FRB95_004964 [Tulasnella sp. JGI-2019a]|nr:hypothetical protein FRB95_004964 [Tulasnella sp. JGI-2019a]
MQVGNSTLTQNDLNPSFSPTRTAIRQNCTFFASLCTSILAAVGAMLAKQWLQSYQRTGQTGSRQKHVELRAQKWMGAESWRLRPVVEALPTLLLISLALFFAALCDLLWSTSPPVALVVAALAAAGAVFYGLTVIASAADEFCPYQTTVSTFIRELTLESGKFLSGSFLRTDTTRRIRTHFPEFSRMLEGISMAGRRVSRSLGLGSLLKRTLLAGLRLRPAETTAKGPETIHVHSILWMLENATEKEDILACAANIPSLSSLSSTIFVSHSPLFSTLVQRFDAALTDVFVDKIEGSEQSALVLGRAIVHVVIADPIRWAQGVGRTLDVSWVMSALGLRLVSGDLWALCAAAHLALRATASDRGQIDDYIMDQAMTVLPSCRPSTILDFFCAMKLLRYDIPFHLVDPSTGYQDSLISLICLEIVDLAGKWWQPLDQWDQWIKDIWSARNGTNMANYIIRTLEAHDRLILEGVDCENLLQYHTQVLQHFRSSPGAASRSEYSDTVVRTIIQHLSRVLVRCHPVHDYRIASFVGPPRASANDDWEEQLSGNLLVKAEKLQAELIAYVTELLLCFCCISQADNSLRYNSDAIDTVVNGIAKVQVRFVTDVDIIDALHAIRTVISTQSGPSSANYTDLAHRFHSVYPLLIRALDSTSEQVSDAACDVLAAFGDMAWGNIHTPRMDPGLLLSPEIGSAILRSLGRLPKHWSSTGGTISRWLAASIQLDATLATSFDESGTTSLLTSSLLWMDEQSFRFLYKETVQNVAYLFLKRWHLKATNRAYPEMENASEMADTAMRSLAQYVQKYLTTYHRDTITGEILIFIASFVQQAFLLRPAAAAFFGLDLACEALIQRTKRWDDVLAARRDSETVDTTEEEAELAVLALGWARARRAYAGASRVRDETLQYASGAGWWKYGGLYRSCDGSGSSMMS